MADIDDDQDEAQDYSEELAALSESVNGIPDRVAQGVVTGLNPPATPEQVKWANDVLNNADTYDDDMQALLDKRGAVTTGPQGTLERLKAARARLAGQTYDQDNRRMWGSVAEALGQHGSIGEAMGRTAGAINKEREAARKFDEDQQEALTGYDTAIGTAEIGSYDAEIKALQHKIDARNNERIQAAKILGKGSSNGANGSAPTAARSAVLKAADNWFANERSGVLLNSRIMDEAAQRAGEVNTGPGYGLVASLAKSEHELPAMIGEFIKSINNPDIKELERDVRSVIFPTVRQVLGAQFTAKENFTLLETAFDPSAPREVNRRRLELILLGLRDAAHVKDAYYTYAREHGGDMTGYTGPDISLVDQIGDRILGYATRASFPEAEVKPKIERPGAPAPNTTDQYIADPRDRNKVIRNPNFKAPVAAPAADAPPPRVIAPKPGEQTAAPAKKDSVWDMIRRKAGEKFAEGGEVDAPGETEVVIVDGRELTVPVGMTDDEIYDFLERQRVAEEDSRREMSANSKDALAELAVDSAAAGTGFAGAYALSRLRDAANERMPHELSFGSESYDLPSNPNYLSPGQRRFVDRFGPENKDLAPEQRLEALIERHRELQTERGLPTATAAEAMAPEQLSLVNEAIRSPNSTGKGAAELRTRLGENQAAMLAGDPHDVDASGRARSEGHTLDTIQAGLQSNRPYTDVLAELEQARKDAYDPLRKAAMGNKWVPVSAFNPELIADTDVGRGAIERARQSWLNNADTHGRPMLRGRKLDPSKDFVTPSSYDVEFLDAVRKALNDMHVESVSGKGNFSARDINAWRRRYTDALYAARPDLAAANAEFERLSRPIDAARVGRGEPDANRILWRNTEGNYNRASAFNEMPVEELRDYLASLDPDSRAALRSGLYENYRSSIQDTSAGRNPLERIFGSEERPSENMNRLKLLFEEDPEGLQTLLDDLKAHSNSYDIASGMGAKAESARGRPRGAPPSKAGNVGSRTVDAVTSPARRLVQGPEGDRARKFSAEEIDDIARIAAEHRLSELQRLGRAAGNRAGRKGRARRAGVLGAVAAGTYALKDKLRKLADEALGYEETEEAE